MTIGFRTAVVTSVVAFAVALSLSAERLPVRTFTTADGLPRDQLQCVRSDQRGFVWFCTAEGLVRFDGQSAVTYDREHGLSQAGVRTFLSASGDRYFVGAGEGLFAFDTGFVTSPVRFTYLARDDGQPTEAVNALAESRDRTVARPEPRHPHRRGCAGDAPACSCGWPHRIAALTWSANDILLRSIDDEWSSA